MKSPSRAPWVRQAILAGHRYHVRHRSRVWHNAINLGALFGILCVIGATLWAGTAIAPLLYVPLAATLLGLCYFSLFVLVVHEASHQMFLVHRSRVVRRRLNRIAGWAVSLLFATHYVKHWEEGHIEHHMRPLEPNDPQQHNILTGKALLVRLLANLFVPGFLFLERTVFRTKRAGGKSTSSARVIAIFIAIWAVVLGVSGAFIGPPCAIALFLGVHVLSALNQIKGALEHGGAIGREADPYLRSRSTFFLLRRLIMPFNITLHFEHHLNYAVPWYDLLRYHRDLLEIVPEEILASVINRRPLAQLTGELGGVGQSMIQPAQPSAVTVTSPMTK